MDLFFDDIEFNSTEINQLKLKNNGGKRLLISYMSIGEAEDYRYYWVNSWSVGSPSWIQAENPDWEGNYEFVEAEAQTLHHHRIERHLLKRYKDTYQRHFDLWKTMALKHGVLMARIPSEISFQSALQYEAISAKVVEF